MKNQGIVYPNTCWSGGYTLTIEEVKERIESLFYRYDYTPQMIVSVLSHIEYTMLKHEEPYPRSRCTLSYGISIEYKKFHGGYLLLFEDEEFGLEFKVVLSDDKYKDLIKAIKQQA